MSNAALKELSGFLSEQYPAAVIECKPWGSSTVFLDVFLNGRHFVMEFRPTHGFGVSENTEEADGWKGHDQAFETFAEAKQHLLKLLSSSAPSQDEGHSSHK